MTNETCITEKMAQATNRAPKALTLSNILSDYQVRWIDLNDLKALINVIREKTEACVAEPQLLKYEWDNYLSGLFGIFVSHFYDVTDSMEKVIGILEKQLHAE